MGCGASDDKNSSDAVDSSVQKLYNQLAEPPMHHLALIDEPRAVGTDRVQLRHKKMRMNLVMKRRVERLCAATQSGNVVELAQLLSTREGLSSINEYDSAGYSPMHRAANDSQFEATKVLVDKGAEIEIPG